MFIYFRNNNLVKKSICYCLSFTLAALPTITALANTPQKIIAEQIKTELFKKNARIIQKEKNKVRGSNNNDVFTPSTYKAGRSGSSFGKQLQSSSLDMVNSNLSKVQNAGTPSKQKNITPTGGYQNMENVNDKDQRIKISEQVRSSLYADAKKNNPKTAVGKAYKIVLNDLFRPKDDPTRKDTSFHRTNNIYKDADSLDAIFGNCTEDTSFGKKDKWSKIKDEKLCTQFVVPRGNCEIIHKVEINTQPTDIVFLVDNSGSMKAVIRDLTENIKQFAALVRGKTADADSIRFAGVKTRWSDYKTDNFALSSDINGFQNWLNNIKETPGQTYNVDAGFYVMQNFEFRRDSNVHKIIVIIGNEDHPNGGNVPDGSSPPGTPNDYYPEQFNNYANSLGIKVFSFHDNARFTEISSRIDTHFSGAKLLEWAKNFAVITESWDPESCVKGALAITDKMCTGSLDVVNQIDGAGCIMLDGFRVCRGDKIWKQLTSPIPTVPREAQRVNVGQLDCKSLLPGRHCWTDTQGNTQCNDAQNDVKLVEGINSDCDEFKKNPKCEFIKNQCIDGMQGESGFCYVSSSLYDCGEPVNIGGTTIKDTISCDGIKCKGGECVNLEREVSDDFKETVSKMQAVESMLTDTTCAEQQNLSSCKIFQGKFEDCVRSGAFGLKKCCKAAAGVNFGDYINLVLSVKLMDSSIAALSGPGSGMVKGAYTFLKTPVINSFTTITKPISGFVDGITGSVKQAFEPVTKAIAQLKQKLISAVKNLWNNITGGAAGTGGASGAGGATAGAAQEGGKGIINSILGETGAMILGWIAWAYAVYSVAKLVVGLLSRCSENDIKLQVQLAMKNCSYVGSYKRGGWFNKKYINTYCCYNAPLPRIIMTQIREKQTGWGSTRNPNCSGISVDEMQNIDWNQIDLSEWQAILEVHGKNFNPNNITIDSLTGSGNIFNEPQVTETGGIRPDASKRAVKRLENVQQKPINTSTETLLKNDIAKEFKIKTK